MARSRDGVSWERHPDNPILAGDDDLWDYGGICKVSIVREDDGYRLWYNASNEGGEQIGMAIHKGFQLFPEKIEDYSPMRGENLCQEGVFSYYYHRYSLLKNVE